MAPDGPVANRSPSRAFASPADEEDIGWQRQAQLADGLLLFAIVKAFRLAAAT
jgi:hypothetical protein